MPRVGACRDRLADAFERFGRVPIERRTLIVSADHPIFRRRTREPFWAAGGLVHDGHGRVLLLRHTPDRGWGTAWVTPGGRLREGETTLDGFLREVREETGLEVVDVRLTRIFQQNLTDTNRVRHGYFAQFIARAASLVVRPGPDVLEARWFERIPEDLAFREDYLQDFESIARGP